MNLKDYTVISSLGLNLRSITKTVLVIERKNLDACKTLMNEDIIVLCNEKYYLIKNASYVEYRVVNNYAYSVVITYTPIQTEPKIRAVKDITVIVNREKKIDKLLNR